MSKVSRLASRRNIFTWDYDEIAIMHWTFSSGTHLKRKSLEHKFKLSFKLWIKQIPQSGSDSFFFFRFISYFDLFCIIWEKFIRTNFFTNQFLSRFLSSLSLSLFFPVCMRFAIVQKNARALRSQFKCSCFSNYVRVNQLACCQSGRDSFLFLFIE